MHREHHAIPLSASCTRTAPRLMAALAAVLLALACLWTGRAEAQTICWGKVCDGPTNDVCCGGHGTCVSYNYCVCNAGYAGIECMVKPVTPYKTALDFGAAPAGSPGTEQDLMLSVLADTSELSATLSGEGSGDYTVATDCPTDFTKAALCAVTVGFSPSGIGSRPATLTLSATYTEIKYSTTYTTTATLPVTLSGSGSVAVRDIVIDPITPATLYAAIAGSGIYKSLNSGAAWTAATTQPADTRLTALAIKPSDTATLFAATDGGGVFISRDSGLTWNACADTGLDSPNVLSLIVTGAGQLFAGTEAGVFTSANDCSSWTAQNTGLPE